MRFRTKILNHFCRGCGTLLSADERQTGLCSSCWFEKEKKQFLNDKDWQEELLRELDGYQPMAGRMTTDHAGWRYPGPIAAGP